MTKHEILAWFILLVASMIILCVYMWHGQPREIMLWSTVSLLSLWIFFTGIEQMMRDGEQ